MMGRNILAKRLALAGLGMIIASAFFIWWRGNRGEQPQQPQARAAATIETIAKEESAEPASGGPTQTPTPTETLVPLQALPVEEIASSATATVEPSGGLRALIGQNQDSPLQPDPPTRVPPSSIPTREQQAVPAEEAPQGEPGTAIGEILKKGKEALEQGKQALAPPTPTPTPQPGIVHRATFGHPKLGLGIALIIVIALAIVTGFVGIERV